MRIIYMSVKLFLYGYFCDTCVNLCTVYTEKNLQKNLPLNKKLLINLSNFSDKSLLKWQSMEKEYIRLCLEKGSFRL